MQKKINNYSTDTNATLFTKQMYDNLSSSNFNTKNQLPYDQLKNKFWNNAKIGIASEINAREPFDIVKTQLTDKVEPWNEIKNKLANTSTAILSTHILRKCMYDSLDYKTPQATVSNTYKSWLKGIHYNWARGTSAVFFQWLIKDEVEKRAGLGAGIFAAGFLGMIAALSFESSLIYGSRIFILNPYLAGLYLTRETLFSFITFANQDQSSFVKYPNLIIATFLTAGVQNLLITDIRRPKFKPGIKAPNLRDGNINLPLLSLCECTTWGLASALLIRFFGEDFIF